MRPIPLMTAQDRAFGILTYREERKPDRWIAKRFGCDIQKLDDYITIAEKAGPYNPYPKNAGGNQVGWRKRKEYTPKKKIILTSLSGIVIGRFWKHPQGPDTSKPTYGMAKEILRHVSKFHAMTVKEMLSKRRHKIYVRARQEAIYWISKECSTLSLPGIGRIMGNLDHTTIIHAKKRYQERIDASDPDLWRPWL